MRSARSRASRTLGSSSTTRMRTQAILSFEPEKCVRAGLTRVDRCGESARMRWVVVFLLVLLCLPAGARAAVNQTGYWAFDEGAGLTAADSAGGHPATLSGGALWTTGAKGYALALNGTSAYADTGAPVIDTTRSFSVSARVKLDRLDRYQTF